MHPTGTGLTRIPVEGTPAEPEMPDWVAWGGSPTSGSLEPLPRAGDAWVLDRLQATDRPCSPARGGWPEGFIYTDRRLDQRFPSRLV